MSDLLNQYFSRTSDWISRAQARGWLSEHTLNEYRLLEKQTPDELFTDKQTRPLVVGFFGGTGVGKSSLLNRLAGEAVARTGVERPTSHEVTVYIHEAIELARLPEAFPVEQVQIRQHRNAAQHNVAWIDMPDIDSTVTTNRELALAWLPHIDLLVYVVSPERYRDDSGWKVLRQRGHRHGWIFVMNHWDEAASEQLDDMLCILRDAGFSDPILLRTSCPPDNINNKADDFDVLQTHIDTLLKEHGLQELERLGYAARIEDNQHFINDRLVSFADNAAWDTLTGSIAYRWKQTHDKIISGMSWPVQTHAEQIARLGASHESGFLNKLGGQKKQQNANDATSMSSALSTQELWDDWAQVELENFVDSLEVDASRHAIASQPLRSQLDPLIEAAPALIHDETGNALRQALAKPGTFLQRNLFKLAHLLSILLPLTALLWVSYHVVTGFYYGVTGKADHLGINYAINSILMVTVAWLLPFLLKHKLKPSLHKTAVRGLTQGLNAGLDRLHERILVAIDELEMERRQFVDEAQQIVSATASLQFMPGDTSSSVSRLLATAVAETRD